METTLFWASRLVESPLTAFNEFNKHVNSHYADPRSLKWPLVDRIEYPLVGIVLYLLTTLYILPRYMRNRPAYDLKNAMLIYNVAMVILSVVTTYEFIFNAYMCDYYPLCQPHEVSYNPREVRIAFAMWLYYISKYIELLDTVFMVLRKRQRQVSFLHLYHHAAMLFLGHTLIRFGPTGQGALISSINAFIHIVMYTYYAASPFPSLQKYLWWKRYVTQMQLVQFFMQVGSTFYGLLTGCSYHPWMAWLQVGFCLTLIVLFSNFYIQNYRAEKRSKREASAAAAIVKNKSNNIAHAANEFTNELNEKPIPNGKVVVKQNGGIAGGKELSAGGKVPNGILKHRAGAAVNGKTTVVLNGQANGYGGKH